MKIFFSILLVIMLGIPTIIILTEKKSFYAEILVNNV